MPARRRSRWPALALALVPLLAGADETAQKADAANRAESPEETDALEELLEFLGSVDFEDEDWIDYLSETDIGKVARMRAIPESEVKKDD